MAGGERRNGVAGRPTQTGVHPPGYGGGRTPVHGAAAVGTEPACIRPDMAVEERRFGPMRAYVRSLALSRDGKTLAAGTFPETPAGGAPKIHVWETATGRSLAPPLWHRSRVNQAFFSPSGQQLVTAGPGEVRLWDLPALDATGPAFWRNWRPTATWLLPAAVTTTTKEPT